MTNKEKVTELHRIFAGLHYYNYHDGYDELKWTELLDQAKKETRELLQADEVKESVEGGVYCKCMNGPAHHSPSYHREPTTESKLRELKNKIANKNAQYVLPEAHHQYLEELVRILLEGTK